MSSGDTSNDPTKLSAKSGGNDVGGARRAPEILTEISLPKRGSPTLVGWLVAIAGPLKGSYYKIIYGNNSIGRDRDNSIAVGEGDPEISRKAHAFISYDLEGRVYSLLGNPSARNLIRFQNSPVYQHVTLTHGDEFDIGSTKMKLIALCGPSFEWTT